MNNNTSAEQLFIAQNPIKPTKNYEGSIDLYVGSTATKIKGDRVVFEWA